jgi:hypothetical protein
VFRVRGGIVAGEKVRGLPDDDRRGHEAFPLLEILCGQRCGLRDERAQFGDERLVIGPRVDRHLRDRRGLFGRPPLAGRQDLDLLAGNRPEGISAARNRLMNGFAFERAGCRQQPDWPAGPPAPAKTKPFESMAVWPHWLVMLIWSSRLGQQRNARCAQSRFATEASASSYTDVPGRTKNAAIRAPKF